MSTKCGHKLEEDFDSHKDRTKIVERTKTAHGKHAIAIHNDCAQDLKSLANCRTNNRNRGRNKFTSSSGPKRMYKIEWTESDSLGGSEGDNFEQSHVSKKKKSEGSSQMKKMRPLYPEWIYLE